MKNRNNKILAAILCSTIIGSMALTLFGIFNKDKGEDIVLNNELEESTDNELEENINDLKEENLEDLIEIVDNRNEVISSDKEGNSEGTTQIIAVESETSTKSENTSNNNVSSSNTSGLSNNSTTNNNINSNTNNGNSNGDNSTQKPPQESGDKVEGNEGAGGEQITPEDNESNNTVGYIDGIYEGTAKGYEKGVQVKVEVSAGKIINVVVVSHNDMPMFADLAIETMPGRIIAAQSTNVDTVSGATYTSKGIIKAVNNALNN